MDAVATIIGDAFAAIIKGFLGLFAKSPEEKLGIAETENASAKKENASLAQALAISDRVDNLVDLDAVRTSLNERP